MVRPLVCILGTGDWSETNRAVASARRFGLGVAVGVSGEQARGTPHPDARGGNLHRAIFGDGRFASCRLTLYEDRGNKRGRR